MIKQPDLGRKITELRKAKGWTQEELVEKCNISVRTIQRIETGEVTPRSYTVKTILAALDFDFNQIAGDDGAALRDYLRFDIDPGKSPGYVANQLRVAWVFGIIYFILGFPEAAIEYSWYSDDDLLGGNTGFVVIKVLVLVSYAFFQRGFVLLGGVFDNYLLRITALILIGTNTLIYCYDIISIFYDSFAREFVMLGASMSFGALGIIYGVALRRLEKQVGKSAELAGLFEIIAGACFVTVVLFIVGFIALIPAVILEIIVLFKARDVLRAKSVEE